LPRRNHPHPNRQNCALATDGHKVHNKASRAPHREPLPQRDYLVMIGQELQLKKHTQGERRYDKGYLRDQPQHEADHTGS
jgi:hypothetical protein